MGDDTTSEGIVRLGRVVIPAMGEGGVLAKQDGDGHRPHDV